MNVQTFALWVNDPMLFACAWQEATKGVEDLIPRTVTVLGTGHYTNGEPLLASHRPPFRSPWGLPRDPTAMALMASCDGPSFVQDRISPPYRFRQWLSVLTGRQALLSKDALEALAVPTYIGQTRKTDHQAESVLHVALAFLHASGQLGVEWPSEVATREAIRNTCLVNALWPDSRGRANCLILTNGQAIHGVTLDRPLYYRMLGGLEECTACGGDVDGNPVSHSRLKGIALLDVDGLPPGSWQTIGPNTLFSISDRFRLDSESL